MSVAIKVKDLIKKYGETTVIPDLSVEIKNGEFFTLLGPSGCGKTTLLRMIAGFNSIEGGTISFDDQLINDIPAYERNIGMVFQNYAIFPHLTVKQNVAYGLKIRKLAKDVANEKVQEILDVVKIKEYQDRLPENLSGGQQQRVALARAIVIHPSVLLMDEPLSNLDAKLRVEMRSAIREVQNKVGITTVYVTHDQEEALAISDRIAIMNKGVIQQIASPEVIYTRPYNVFVSTFIGHSNLFCAKLQQNGQQSSIKFADGTEITMDNLVTTAEQDIIVSIRPEEFSLAESGLKAKVINKTFLGKYINYELQFEDGLVMADQASIEYSQDIGHAVKTYQINDEIYLQPNCKKINIFNHDGTVSLIKGVVKYDK